MSQGIRSRFVSLFRRSRPSSTLDQAVAEIEVYMIDALGREPEDLAVELADPDMAAEIERRYRQLVVWVRLLLTSRWLYRQLGFMERRRVRRLIRGQLDSLADFHAERLVPALATGPSGNELAALASELFASLASARAVLLNVVGRVDVPFSETVRASLPLVCSYPPPAAPGQPRIALRGVVARSLEAPQDMTRHRSVRRSASERVAGDAKRVLDLCLETLALPHFGDTEEAALDRPWS